MNLYSQVSCLPARGSNSSQGVAQLCLSWSSKVLTKFCGNFHIILRTEKWLFERHLPTIIIEERCGSSYFLSMKFFSDKSPSASSRWCLALSITKLTKWKLPKNVIDTFPVLCVWSLKRAAAACFALHPAPGSATPHANQSCNCPVLRSQGYPWLHSTQP